MFGTAVTPSRSNTKTETDMEKEFFGTLATGEAVHLYTLKSKDATLKICDFGAIVAEFEVFSRNIVGGFDRLEDYAADDSHQGGIIGRVANRIENASFTMNGKEYHLPKNDGDNCLHGGCGFDRRMWTVTEHTDSKISLFYHSADMEEGFPSSLDVRVDYILDGTALIIDYYAMPDGKTPVSLTNHTYFNLSGFGGDILDHKVEISADEYTVVNEKLIPTCRSSVAGTPYDFRTERTVRLGDTVIEYDHNYILSSGDDALFLGKELKLGAVVKGGGLSLSVYTDMPCLQFYIGNFLGTGPAFKGGIPQIKHGAMCLEAQTEPNSVKRGVGFFNGGDTYRQTTVYEVKRL